MFKIDGRDIHPTFIIAEAANNHLCEMEAAKSMIRLAKWAGADAIKFQMYKAEHLVTSKSMTYWAGEKIPQIDYYRQLDKFGFDEYKELFECAKALDIIAFASPFDIPSVKMLGDLDVPLFKIASCCIDDTRLIKTIASYGKPIILSCGGATEQEIHDALQWIYVENNSVPVALLFCTFIYPTPPKKVNLSRLNQYKWNSPIYGFSDHTVPTDDEHLLIPSIAVGMGAKIIEKHFTLDRNTPGSGNFYGTEPREFQQMVENIRFVEKVLGSSTPMVIDEEKETAKSSRRKLVANMDIKKNSIITNEMIGVKRTEDDGISPSMLYQVIGRKTDRLIKKDEPILFGEILWMTMK